MAKKQQEKEKRTGKEKIFTLLITIMALAIATQGEEFWRLTPTTQISNTLSPISISNRLCIFCRNASTALQINGTLTTQNLTNNNLKGTNNALIYTQPNGTLERTQNFNQYIEFPGVFNTFIEQNKRNLDENVHGVLQQELTGQTLNNAINITYTHGIGKIGFMVLAGTDTDGTMEVTCDIVDRNTGTITQNVQMNITISGLSTDNSFTDNEGNTVHNLKDGYLTDQWCFSNVNVSVKSGNLDISNMDIYHTSFEQFNDVERIILDTFDFNGKVKNTNAWLKSYLYQIQNENNRFNVTQIANWSLDSTDITQIGKYYRLRKGQLNTTINGSHSGIFQDVFFGRNNQQDWEDITMKIWFRKIIPIQ